MIMKADNILVEPLIWSEIKQGSILLPDNTGIKKNFEHGKVKGVGPGLYLQNGTQCKVEVEVGDRVLYCKSRRLEIQVAGAEMHVIREADVIAVLEDGDFETDEQETDNATT